MEQKQKQDETLNNLLEAYGMFSTEVIVGKDVYLALLSDLRDAIWDDYRNVSNKKYKALLFVDYWFVSTTIHRLQSLNSEVLVSSGEILDPNIGSL